MDLVKVIEKSLKDTFKEGGGRCRCILEPCGSRALGAAAPLMGSYGPSSL